MGDNGIFRQIAIASNHSLWDNILVVRDYSIRRFEMKRKNFEIIKNGVYLETKHAWNSSIRAIEADVNKVAHEEDTVYNLVDAESIKEGFYMVSGYRIWVSVAGNTFKYEINLLG
jgi:hypothetical protein